MQKVVGVVGLGIMGGAISRNLLRSGWKVFGFDIDPLQRAKLADLGAVSKDDVISLASVSPTILLSLPSEATARTTAKSIAESGLPTRTVIEASTLALEDKMFIRDVLERSGHVVLDCPISGTGAQAANKDIVVYASGDTEKIAELRPLFASFARDMHDLGEYGNGSKMKIVANLLVAIHNVASAEAVVLGMKAGLDPAKLVSLVTAGAGTSRIFELRAPMMARNCYTPPTMRLANWQKDMNAISNFARELNCPTPLLNATAPIYAAALANGHAADDTAAVCRVLEIMAGVKR